MFATDILKVFYAPHKIFKEIIQKPKYWGPLLVLIIVIAAQTAFSFAQSEQVYYEQTYPASSNLGLWSTNATLWTASPGVTISNNYVDYLNSSLYGNGSLQFSALSTNDVGMALPSFASVDCSPSNFQNLSVRVKQVDPLSTPSKVTVTLYSEANSNYFQYDLTNSLSNASLIGLWNNITIPVGSNASGWQNVGNPQWSNVTGLKLDFTYASNANVTLRIEGLFFRGEYKTLQQLGLNVLAVALLEQAFFALLLQYVFEWIILTALVYIIIKGLKGTVTWKPLFIVIGFILVVMAIQAIISIAATTTLPVVHYQIELQASLPGEADVLGAVIAAQTQTYTVIALVILPIASYVWIAALVAFAVRATQPEFSFSKCALTASAAVIATIILTSLLGSL